MLLKAYREYSITCSFGLAYVEILNFTYHGSLHSRILLGPQYSLHAQDMFSHERCIIDLEPRH
jgi:hypothetical protein